MTKGWQQQIIMKDNEKEILSEWDILYLNNPFTKKDLEYIKTLPQIHCERKEKKQYK